MPKKNLNDICVQTLSDNKSLSEKLIDSIKNNKMSVLGVEGKIESGWVLVDCGDVVINIMKNDVRDFYDLEGLWGENTLLNSSN